MSDENSSNLHELDDASLSFVYVEDEQQQLGRQQVQHGEEEEEKLEEVEEGIFYGMAQPRSSTPLADDGDRSATPTAFVAVRPQLDDFSAVTEGSGANLEEITGDFDLFRLEGAAWNGPAHDGREGRNLDQQLHAFGHRMMANTDNASGAVGGSSRHSNPSNVGGPRAEQRQNMQAPALTTAQMPMQVAAPQEFMASIELCLFSQGSPMGPNPNGDHPLYKDKHLVTWTQSPSVANNVATMGCHPLLCQKVEQIVRQSGESVLVNVAGQNFERLEKRAWAKFRRTPAGRKSQFHGQLFHVDYDSEQMKNETEYTVHLCLPLSLPPPPNFVRPVPNAHVVFGRGTDDGEEMVAPVVMGFTVWIMDLHGRNHRIDGMRGETRIDELKARVAEKTGMPREQQRLIFLGKPIDGEENRELGSFKITKNATIHLAMRLKGGDQDHRE